MCLNKLEPLTPKNTSNNLNNYLRISQKMKNICIKASIIVLKYYESYKKNNKLNYNIKIDGSPVTEADKKSNSYIVSHLKDNFPDIPIISEELKNKTFLSNKKFFLVDPLDGTKEFLKMNGQFTVNIGYVENNKAVLGAVSIPLKNKIYWTQNNLSFSENIVSKKAIDGRDIKSIKKLYCKKKTNVKSISISRSHVDEKTSSYIRKYKFKSIKKIGSSMKILEVCDNNIDLYPRFGKTMEWDICGAHAILKLAGGKILDSKKNEVLYGKENYENEEFFVFGNIINSDKYI